MGANKAILLLIAASFYLGAAKAEVFTSGCSLQVNQACTLAELVSDPDAYLQIDGVRFLNFVEFNIPFDIASHISVAAIDGPGGANRPGSVVGLEFTPIDGMPSLLEEFSGANFERFLSFSYDIQVNSGLPIGAASTRVQFGEFVFNLGSDSVFGGIAKTIDRPGLGQVGMNAACRETRPAEPGCAGTMAADDVTFGPARSLSIGDLIYVVNFTRPVTPDSVPMPAQISSGVQILNARQTYFRIPEPGVLALLGIGAALFTATRRRPAAADRPA